MHKKALYQNLEHNQYNFSSYFIIIITFVIIKFYLKVLDWVLCNLESGLSSVANQVYSFRDVTPLWHSFFSLVKGIIAYDIA